jgi:hypothetical protein
MKKPAPRRRKMQGAPDISAELELAYQIRALYIEERNAFEQLRGRTSDYKPSAHWDGHEGLQIEDVQISAGRQSIWQQLARIFIVHRIDPAVFIANRFDGVPLDGRIPEPNHFIGAKARKLWEKDKCRKEEEIELALTIQRNVARRSVLSLIALLGKSKDEACALTLLDDGLELSALFRYCLACSIPGKRFAQIAKFFETSACLQFERYRKFYQHHWKDFLPSGFSTRSRAVYRYMFEEGHGQDDEEEVEEIS